MVLALSYELDVFVLFVNDLKLELIDNMEMFDNLEID